MTGPAATGPADIGVSAAVTEVADRAGVELVPWPADEARRQHLARGGVPRLLLLDTTGTTPPSIGLDEDWLRLPASDGDVIARLERLAHAVERLRHEHPVLDGQRIVHFAGTHVLLTRPQAAVVSRLLEQPGRVVSRRELEAATWPDATVGPRALDAVVFRVRRRLAGLGIVVRNAHAHGFALDLPETPRHLVEVRAESA